MDWTKVVVNRDSGTWFETQTKERYLDFFSMDRKNRGSWQHTQFTWLFTVLWKNFTITLYYMYVFWCIHISTYVKCSICVVTLVTCQVLYLTCNGVLRGRSLSGSFPLVVRLKIVRSTKRTKRWHVFTSVYDIRKTMYRKKQALIRTLKVGTTTHENIQETRVTIHLR